MKILHWKTLLAAALLLTSVLNGCDCTKDEEPKATDLNGTWLGSGYQCPVGTSHDERVSIKSENGTLIATKIDGDDCVKAGQVTFFGAYDGVAATVSLTLNTGSPLSPSCCSVQAVLTIIDDDTLELAASGSSEVVTFSRL